MVVKRVKQTSRTQTPEVVENEVQEVETPNEPQVAQAQAAPRRTRMSWTMERNLAFVEAIREILGDDSRLLTSRTIYESLRGHEAFEGTPLSLPLVRIHVGALRKSGVQIPKMVKTRSSKINVDDLNAALNQ